MGKPHALVIPFPALGHVKPLMELSYRFVDHGFTVTFANTDFNHARVVAALKESGEECCHIRLVSFPDGMAPGENRNQLRSLCDALQRNMGRHLEALMGEINAGGGDKITCMIIDVGMWPALEVAEKLGIRQAAFYPASAASMVSFFAIPKLLEDGTLDVNGRILLESNLRRRFFTRECFREKPTRKQQDGIPTKHKMIKLSPTMPAMNTAHMPWLIGDEAESQILFHFMEKFGQTVKEFDWLVCNSFYELEAPTYSLAPNIQPIGPILSSNQVGEPSGKFWAEESSCLRWLSKQPPRSVIYIAFGSLAIFNEHQFHELALGLELTNRSFLWVVRPDLTNGPETAFPNGFKDRVAVRGHMVSWSPQEKVLAHPSIACFLTHCGWNSTMEGLSMGVPFLCWPYFADQFLNRGYIVDEWKVGLGLEGDINGIITKEEVKNKIDKLLNDEGIRERVLELKDKARRSMAEGGSSSKNFRNFVEAMKG